MHYKKLDLLQGIHFQDWLGFIEIRHNIISKRRRRSHNTIIAYIISEIYNKSISTFIKNLKLSK